VETFSPAAALSDQPNPALIVIGCGDLGGAVATHFARANWRVYGVRRQSIALPNVTMLTADVTQANTLEALQNVAADYVVVVLTPGQFSDQRYRDVYVGGAKNILNKLNKSKLKRVFWISSTSVYHQNDGEWIDEDSPAAPNSFSGARLLEAENTIAASGLPHTLIRFGGIYGLGRTRLLQQLREGQRSAITPPRYSNRIHRDDAVGILQFLLNCERQNIALQSLYLGVDTEPALMSDIEHWVCKFLHIDYDALAESAPAARGGSRRCSSARLQALGYRFLYPTYREGLKTLLI
jgi:nucleoside-diphosphate-sugar epimerase